MCNLFYHFIWTQALTISNKARQDTTVGEIVNLMSVDGQRILNASSYYYAIWSAPLQVQCKIVTREVGLVLYRYNIKLSLGKLVCSFTGTM